MDHFLYRNGVLFAEDVDLREIAATVGTPVYVYSAATFRRHVALFQEALSGLRHGIFFAMKSNGNMAILKLLHEAGCGIDVVSGGEYAKAVAAGVPGERIVFSGVGKTREEMHATLAGGIRQYNVESEPELRQLSEIAAQMGVEAPIAIRVNPDVDAKTHAKIATGKSENKFGIPISRAREIYREAAALPGIRVVGIDVHIGSQLTDLDPYRAAFKKVAELYDILTKDGHEIDRLDLGGGLGIPYARDNAAPPLPLDYGAVVRETLGHIDCEIDIEPGRLIAGNAGILLSKVIFEKSGEDRDFLILDAAMNDLIRPAMYEAFHEIVPVTEPEAGAESKPYDIVGPVCESGDTFAKARHLAPQGPGALVAFRSAGAYGAVMSSEYNARPLIPEVLVDGDQFAVIRPRPTYEEMIERDRLPPWMS